MKILSFLLALLPVAAFATDRPVSPEEFERLVTGRTLSYATNGVAFGAEDYLSNRRVRWSFLDGECTEGKWYALEEQICFVYDDIPAPQCWQFFMQGDQLTAKFTSDPTASQVYQTADQEEPLMCLGPEVGV